LVQSILAAVSGLMLLLAGRRLFWLAVGLLAFLLSWKLVSLFAGDSWLVLGVCLMASTIFAWLAVKFIRWSAYLFGLLGGAFAAPLILGALGVQVNPFMAAALGGVTGLALVMITLNWGLILLTAFTGASVIASGVRESLSLTPPPTNILFLLLLILGVAWQGATQREKR